MLLIDSIVINKLAINENLTKNVRILNFFEYEGLLERFRFVVRTVWDQK